MVLINDLLLNFVNSELVPKIVSKTVELHESKMTVEEIIKEICHNDFSTSSMKKDALKTVNHKERKEKKEKEIVEPVSLDEYIEKHSANPVCVYIFIRGADKDKVCCKAISSSDFDLKDKKTWRCEKHKNSSAGPDIDAVIAKSKAPSKNEQVAKMRKTLPKGAPEALSIAPPTPDVGSGLGKISIKDKLEAKALTIENGSRASETPKSESSSCVVTPVKNEGVKIVEVVSSEEDKPFTPVKEEKEDPIKEPTPIKEEKLDEDHVPPVDSEGEQYYLTTSQPSAEDYNWMMYSNHQALVFAGDYSSCYGVYYSETKINPSTNLSISSAWKKLLRPLSESQEKFVTERGIEVKTIS